MLTSKVKAMRDYAKVHSSFWTSSDIRGFSEDARSLALYLLTCQHGTIAGVFRVPDGYVCEDLQWTVERVSKGFEELYLKGFANRCETTKWVQIIKHFKWNLPENPNQIKAVLKQASHIPDDCVWKLDFMRVCEGLSGKKDKPFDNPLETLSKPVTVTVTVDKEAKASLSGSSNPTDADQKTTKAPICPIDGLIDLYEKTLPSMPRVRRSLFKTGKNGTAMRQRWAWVMTSMHERGDRAGTRLAETVEQGVAWFERYFAYVSDSKFLTESFAACDLGWLLAKENFEKVLSGRYENREGVAA